MSIPRQFKEELRNRVRLSDIIGRRVKVQRAGQEFKACCPFHHEKTPSFTINDQKQFYHCFGCGAHGDVITFVMEHDNLPFMEAMEMLAAEAGMQVPKPTPEAQAQYKKQDRLYAVCQEASRWFRDQLFAPQNKDVLNYALGRGLTEETLEKFKIGYAPGDMNALRETLIQKGFTDKEMIEACLTKPSKKGTAPYAFFRDRLMFPVTDGRGRVVAFGGRILPEDMRPPDRGDFTPPKYMNSSDTPLFHKGRLVFNQSNARAAAGQDEPLIVTEGYMDVIALSQAGFAGAVAPLGTAMTEEQIQLCWHMIPANIKEPYICFDGDNAGKRAAERAVERMLPMLAPGQSARFIFMPAGEDPDSLIKKKGKGAFDKALHDAQPLVDVLWQTLIEGQSFDTPERLAALEKSINEKCAIISDQSVAYHYKTKLRAKMREEFPMRKPWNKDWKPNKGGFNGRIDNVVSMPMPRDNRSVMQAAILSALYHAPALIEDFEDRLSMLDITDETMARAREILIDSIHEECITKDMLVKHIEDQNEDIAIFARIEKVAGQHLGFLQDENDLDTIEKAVNQLLQNLSKRGNYTNLGEAARALLEKDVETTQ